MDFTQDEPGIAMEIIRTLGKELKESRERMRHLEGNPACRRDASIQTETSPTPGVSEALYTKLQEERDDLADEAWKWKLKVTNMQAEIEDLIQVYQARFPTSQDHCKKKETEAGDPGPGRFVKQESKSPDADRQLQRRIGDLEAENRAYASEVQSLKHQNKLLSDAHRQAIAKSDELVNSVKEIEGLAEASNAENETLSKEKLCLHTRIETLESERDNLLQEIKNSQSKLRLAEIEAATWQRHCLEEGSNKQEIQNELHAHQAQLQKRERKLRELNESLKRCEEMARVWSVVDFQKFCSESIPGLQVQSFQPICSISRRHLLMTTIGKELPIKDSEVLYLPSGLYRLPRVGLNRDHILFFAPQYRYDAGSKRWESGNGFGLSHGAQLVTFFSNSKTIYYAGTYRVRTTKAENPRGAMIKPSTETAQALAEATITNGVKPEWNSVDPRYAMQEAMKDILKVMYMSGVLKVEGVVLQFVNRDPALASSLVERYGGAQSVTRRGRSEISRCSSDNDSDPSSSAGASQPANKRARRDGR